MGWWYVIGAGFAEVIGAVLLKYSEGFTRPALSVLTVVAMGFSLWLLGLSVRYLPLGTAYAFWTGLGALGTVAAGVILFSEAVTLARIVCIVLVAMGLIGLNLSATE